MTLHFREVQPTLAGLARSFDAVPRGALVLPIVEGDEDPIDRPCHAGRLTAVIVCIRMNFHRWTRALRFTLMPIHQLKVVEFGPGASQHWNQGGFLFVADANPEAINLVREHTKGLEQLNRCWFAYEECGLFFALGRIHDTFPTDISGWLD